MNIHEYQAKAVLREFGVPVPRGIAGHERRRSRQGRQRARRAGLGREGADPRRRARQGRRRQGGEIGRRRRTRGRAPARLDAGHASDRAAGQGGAPPLHRGRLRHRPRILSLRAGRSRHRRASPSSPRPRAAWKSRRSRARSRRRFSQLLGRSGDRLHGRITPTRWRMRCGFGREVAKQAESRAAEALSGVPRQGHEPPRDQSAGRHQGRAS